MRRAFTLLSLASLALTSGCSTRATPPRTTLATAASSKRTAGQRSHDGGPRKRIAASANTQTAIVAYGWKPQTDQPYGKGLVAIDITDDRLRSRRLSAAPVSWCLVDHRARVVWYVAEQPAPHLAAYELDSGRTRIAVTRMPSLRFAHPEHIVIAYPDATLGALDPYYFRIAARLHLTDRPRLSPIVGCDGDNAWYCYSDVATVDPDKPEQGLAPELASAARQIRQAQPITQVLRQLAARAMGGPLWLETPAEGRLPHVGAVPKTGCLEDPSLCGVARRIPGTRHFLVVTGNARGDFYHLYQQVYDPTAKRFLHPDRRGAAARAAKPFTPPSEASVHRLMVSPSGDYFLIPDTGQLVSFARGLLLHSSRACGWSRIGGYLDAMSPPTP